MKTIFLPLILSSSLKVVISLIVLICPSLEDFLRLDSYSIISLSVVVALPIFPTTTPAARLENLTALSMSSSHAKAKPSEARTVSPAPVTSKTSLETVGWIRNSSLA